jgi:hypothetical protein
MKLLMLRGPVPQDRNPAEIKYGSLEKSDCFYEHMAYHLGDEGCEIIYFGGKYEAQYSEKCTVRWVAKLKKYRAPFTPDVVWVRGGFKEGYEFAKRYPKAFKIFYGAGKRFCPTRGRFDLVLADSEQQIKRIRKKGYHAAIWTKAAPPQFRPMTVDKKYDCCFVAAIPEDKRKNVKWVYKTSPGYIKVLQLGYYPNKLKVPGNVKVKRVIRSDMPKAMNKCRCLIAPYTKDDSAPRAIVEAMACGLPVVALDETQIPQVVNRVNKKAFWKCVDRVVKVSRETSYFNPCSMDKAVEHLRGLINGR